MSHDPFKPALQESKTLAISVEQQLRIREVLELTCSDSQSVDKAYNAVYYILTHGTDKPEVPTLKLEEAKPKFESKKEEPKTTPKK